MIEFIIRRFLEMLLTCTLISAIAVVFNVTGLFNTRISVLILLLSCAGCWFILNFYLLRLFYFNLRNKKVYYITNFAAYTIFAACTVFVYLCFSNAMYGWIFSITKLFKYTEWDFSTVQSTALFHLLSVIIISCAPIGMGRIFMLDESE